MFVLYTIDIINVVNLVTCYQSECLKYYFWLLQAFEKAWEEACSYEGAVFVVPQKNYLLKPITFSGPCKSNIAVQVRKPEIQTFLKTFLKTLQIISATE